MEKLLYRVTEAAEMLGLSRSKVYVLIQAGVLPSVRVDGCRRQLNTDQRAATES